MSITRQKTRHKSIESNDLPAATSSGQRPRGRYAHLAHPRTINKVDGPEDGIWTSYRRVLGGTVAKGDATYHDQRGSGGVLSDLGQHTLKDGDKLSSPFFPIVYPKFDKKEAEFRDAGAVGCSPIDTLTKMEGWRQKLLVNDPVPSFKVMGSREK